MELGLYRSSPVRRWASSRMVNTAPAPKASASFQRPKGISSDRGASRCRYPLAVQCCRCAISQPRLAIIATMRWAMKPGESAIQCDLPILREDGDNAIADIRAPTPGAAIRVTRVASDPVASSATTRRASSPVRAPEMRCQSSPSGVTRIAHSPSSCCKNLRPACDQISDSRRSRHLQDR